MLTIGKHGRILALLLFMLFHPLLLSIVFALRVSALISKTLRDLSIPSLFSVFLLGGTSMLYQRIFPHPSL